jgi:F0F1-type ATP synthase epsilon subunit
MATIQVDIVSAEGEIHSGEAQMVFALHGMRRC